MIADPEADDPETDDLEGHSGGVGTSDDVKRRKVKEVVNRVPPPPVAVRREWGSLIMEITDN